MCQINIDFIQETAVRPKKMVLVDGHVIAASWSHMSLNFARGFHCMCRTTTP